MATFPEALNGYNAATPADNTPAGTDSVGTQLDDHLRDIKANVKNAGALTPSSTATAAVTMVATDFNKLLLVDPSAAARTVSVLTAAAALAGFRVGIKNVSGANNVIVHRSGSNTIDGEASITLSATNQAVMLACNGTTWYRTSTYTPSNSGASVAVFTSSGTWTKPANLLYAIIEVQGGGGGGGGTANPGSDEAGAGSGGGSGGYARKVLLASALGSTETVTVGAAAAGGSSSDGTDGNASTFAVASGTDVVGNGGTGGKSRASGIASVATLQGVGGGSATGGDINITGSGSGPAICMGNNAFGTSSAQALAFGSAGGSGFFGGGGGSAGATETTAQNGGDGVSGGGGGGAASGDTGAAATGGAGGAGLVVVTQYLSS